MSTARPAWLRVPTPSLTPGAMVLGEEASHYVARVHRRSPGETILLFDPTDGTEALAEIVAVEGKRVRCRVGEVQAGRRCGVAGLHLVQGLGKGDKPDQVVRDGVVLGAQSIRFVICERSVAQSSDRGAAKLERLIRIATEAARQCGRSNLPTIELGVDFDHALALRPGTECGHEPAAPGGAQLMIVVHPGEHLPLVEAVLDVAISEAPSLAAWVWVGPEGGFSDRELNRLTDRGAKLASLGDLVLRTELAAVVALARVGSRLMQSR